MNSTTQYLIGKSTPAIAAQAKLCAGLRSFLLAIPLALLLGACSKEPDEPEEQIRQLIHTAENAAENREHGAFIELLADNFQSTRDLNKQSIEKMLRYYFLRNKTIHLFTRINHIEMLSPSHAKVKLAVAMTGQPVDAKANLADTKADIYRFDLDVVHNKEWKILHAKWARLQLFDF